MTEASIALNRFGLGGRPGDNPSADPKRWLQGQFEQFEARPRSIAALTQSSRIVTQFADYQRKLREFQRLDRAAASSARATAPASKMEPTASAADPSMESMEANSQNAGNEPINQHRRVGRSLARNHYGTAVSARIGTAVAGKAPFVERLAHFWANHFAVSADKLEVLALSGSLEFEAIRQPG